jgi:hypothetical protein
MNVNKAFSTQTAAKWQSLDRNTNLNSGVQNYNFIR